ncbi:MAG: MEKHLA domain-containing protein [Methylomonas sp.]|nr:MEKHLA domain-containing protein [Methylomonas sp.]PPD22354.1 MAG: MEKHLA domain-containing protein [Methylomonas sp.]PPD26857.1 MAG: MEKHLA domain-containing protein [Methylomonas sp.]PPD38764.1 MAG: MEKHLA domain-containing protein [Methylomonas sp.]PPD40192.1 MAG: MEKHLA domain-containing protein [Methylomonas sp.]
MNNPPPAPANRYHHHHIQSVCDSYQRLLHRPLIPHDDGETLAQAVFEADFAVLSHDTATDPLFNYANRTALKLFELSWPELIALPSRFSAEPLERSQRDHLLKTVATAGYVEHYSGVRISKSGRRFVINHAVIWNVYDANGLYCGQAACFDDWRYT